MNDSIPAATREAGWAVDEPLVFELSTNYISGPAVTAAGVPASDGDTSVPVSLLRSTPPTVPAVPEAVLARHFGRLARRNHNLHEGMYPLGSCTMKYNPVVDEQLAWLDGFAQLHPYQDEEDTQGALQLMWELDRMLASITGMARMSLQPAAGAHGEWTGLRMIQAYHADRGDTARTRVLIPNSAHGTNPASAAACGLDVVTVKSNHDGTVDVDDFSSHLDATVAAVMLTNPNTLGVFEKDIVEIARARARCRSTRVLRRRQPQCTGRAWRVPVTWASTSSTSICTRRSRRRTVAVDLEPARSVWPSASSPSCRRRPSNATVTVSSWMTSAPRASAKVRSYYGNFGMLVRAYAYIRAYGDHLPWVARDAVLNARYLQSKLTGLFAMAVETPCMHEFVATTKGGRVEGLRAMDVAKRLLDYGVYAPTVYFPLTVPEALMFEPTETESKQSLDAFAEICTAIVDEAETRPGIRAERTPRDTGEPCRRGARRAPPGAALDAVTTATDTGLRDELRELVAMRAFTYGTFTLTSGRTSDYYVDGKQVTLDGRGLYLVARFTLEHCRDLGIDAVGGLTLGADPIAAATAALSGDTDHPITGVHRSQGGQGARHESSHRGTGPSSGDARAARRRHHDHRRHISPGAGGGHPHRRDDRRRALRRRSRGRRTRGARSRRHHAACAVSAQRVQPPKIPRMTPPVTAPAAPASARLTGRELTERLRKLLQRKRLQPYATRSGEQREEDAVAAEDLVLDALDRRDGELHRVLEQAHVRRMHAQAFARLQVVGDDLAAQLAPRATLTADLLETESITAEQAGSKGLLESD